MARILVIDDDLLLRGTVELILRSEGHEVAAVSDGRKGLKRFRADHFDLVACDALMPNRDGLETIKEIRDLAATLPIIAFTDDAGHADKPGSATDALDIARPLRDTE